MYLRYYKLFVQDTVHPVSQLQFFWYLSKLYHIGINNFITVLENICCILSFNRKIMYSSKCYRIWYTMDNKENLILSYWKSDLLYGIATTKFKFTDILGGTTIADEHARLLSYRSLWSCWQLRRNISTIYTIDLAAKVYNRQQINSFPRNLYLMSI